MIRLAALVTLVFGATLAQAQSGTIQWQRDVRTAINIAQQTRRPLMVYLGGSERDDAGRLERDQKRAFRNDRILRKSQSFVPLKLSRSQHREMLDQFGLSRHSTMEMTFVTPDGEMLGRLSANGIARIGSFAQKMDAILAEYGKHVYEKEVKSVFENEEATAKELQTAMQVVDNLVIEAAVPDMIKMLDRERLPRNIRRLIYEALAKMSTKEAVDKLLDLALKDDKQAAQSLQKCTPPAAEMLLPHMQADKKPFPYVAYQAAARICRLSKPKPERYFEKSTKVLIQKELDRLNERVRTVAMRWKQLND